MVPRSAHPRVALHVATVSILALWSQQSEKFKWKWYIVTKQVIVPNIIQIELANWWPFSSQLGWTRGKSSVLGWACSENYTMANYPTSLLPPSVQESQVIRLIWIQQLLSTSQSTNTTHQMPIRTDSIQLWILPWKTASQTLWTGTSPTLRPKVTPLISYM